MQRDILISILKNVDGLDPSPKEGAPSRCRDGYELTVYLGEPGKAMVVGHVQSIALLAAHAEIEARDRGRLYVPLDSICALQQVQVAAKSGKRSGVGFSG